MMNNEHVPRYTSLPLNGGDLSFSENSAENDELAMNSYYSMQNMANSNPYYRQYENCNDEWAFANNTFGRNLYVDYENPHWQISETAYYPHFPHSNVWPSQLYVHNYDNYHDYRYPMPELAGPVVEDNTQAVSSYGFELENATDNNNLAPAVDNSNLNLNSYQPTTFNPTVVSDGPKPVTDSLESTYQCDLCYHFCVSAGGLKRHAKFCRASSSNLETIFASLRRPNPPSVASSVPPPCAILPDSLPINLTSSGVVVDNNNIVMNAAPTEMNRNIGVESAVACHLPAEVMKITNEMMEPSKSGKSDSAARRRTCPQCPVVVTSERALVQHLTTHNVRKPYECETCGSRFSRKFHLTRHVKQRGCDGRPRAQFPCEYCSKIFSRKDNLREHIKGHTGQSRPRTKLPCPIASCNKKFQGRTQLQVHLNAHSGLRPYACDLCDKTFRSNAALKKHLRVHSGERPFTCTECDARFGAKETLNRHIMTHTCAKPHTCTECGKGFIQPTQLKAHMIQHQNEETFCCSLCDRTYKRRWRLQQHYRIEHNDRKMSPESPEVLELSPEKMSGSSSPSAAHVCDECGKSFALKQSLKVHFLTHVREPPVSCTECSRAFIRRDCLLRHLRTKHRLVHSEAIQVMQNMTQDQMYETKPSSEMDTNAGTSMNLNCIQNVSNVVPSVDSEDLELMEGNIVELLNLLMVDPNALRNFGWPERSVDSVLQQVLIECHLNPCANPELSLSQRLRINTKLLFAYVVDNQPAIESLLARCPIEKILEQVIDLAKPSDNVDGMQADRKSFAASFLPC